MKKTSGFAIASLILGILSIPFILIYGIGMFFGILAIIFGFIALKQIKKHKLSGRGMAIAGIITGFVPVVFIVLAILILGGSVIILNKII